MARGFLAGSEEKEGAGQSLEIDWPRVAESRIWTGYSVVQNFRTLSSYNT